MTDVYSGMDQGHYNCRDYYVAPHLAPVSVARTIRPTLHRDESYDELMERSRSPASTAAKFPLLRLPLELRQLVLSYLLPRTVELTRATAGSAKTHVEDRLSERERKLRTSVKSQSINHLVWLRGNINIMLVCRQLHDECAELIYGTNTFLLFLNYTGISFRFRWQLPHGVAPSRNYPFLELMPGRYLELIRNVIVHVDHVDSYTGMIKFNVGGRGLIHGLRKQAIKLVSALQPRDASQNPSKELSRVVVRISTSNEVIENINRRRPNGQPPLVQPGREQMLRKLQAKDIQDVLEPFGDLMAVREPRVLGAVSSEFAEALEKRMRSHEPRPLHACCDEQDEKDRAMPILCVYGNDI